MPKGVYQHKPLSKETKKKLSEAKKGNKNGLGYQHTEEARRKISKSRKGKHHSEETKMKISLSEKGKEVLEGTRRKLSETHKGAKSYLWKGGIAYDPYPTDWTDDLKESIRKRDGYICQMCGIYQDELEGRFKKLDIHHIDYKKDNLCPDNLISLCRKCHMKTNFDRGYWKVNLVGFILIK